ncbi:MAG: single-stranded DNA-binding protein, partial [Nostoc sp.]
DQHGAAIVGWGGQQFIRRSPANKYDPAIWFSRCTGKAEDGSNAYERLITFKPLSKTEVDPLPEKVTRLVDSF